MAHKLLNSSNLCGIEYIYWPITAYRKLIAKEVLSRVIGGDVLDLGCGQAGIYWSLAYAHRAKSICYFDISEENISAINSQLAKISPEFIQENFADTCEFLVAEGILPEGQASQQLALHILNRVDLVKQFDFRILSTARTFDTIVSIEAIECVSSSEELLSAIGVCHKLLNSGGQLLGVCSKYDRFTERTQELIDTGFAGSLNPDASALRDLFIQCGFHLEYLKTVSTPELHNYSEAIIFDVRKN